LSSADLVKALRDKTGVGIMDCKKALKECNGDMDRAVDYLRKKAEEQKALGEELEKIIK